MTVVFRCNAGPEIGFGHLVRCRALAHALHEKGEDCVMVGPDQSYAKPEDHELFEDWIPVPNWPSSADDAQRLIGISQAQQAKWLVLDDYRVDETYQLALRKAGLRWLQFDGSASKPQWADFVVNANPAARAEDYTSVLRNPDTQLLLGPAYSILRPEFDQVTAREPGRTLKKILVTFGGGDDCGANQFVLSTLLPITTPDQHFLVISGATNPSNPSLKQWIETHGQGRVSLHIDPDLVAQLFASCDLAVMAGGNTTFEAAACGLPMIIVTIADNQWSQAEGWAAHGAAVYAGPLGAVDNARLQAAFIRAAEPKRRCSLSIRAFKLMDRDGVVRIANAVVGARTALTELRSDGL